jgi:hypothetical protein
MDIRRERGALGAALAVAAIVVWSLRADPPDLGFAGIPVALASILAVLILAFRRGDVKDEDRPGVWPLLLSGAVAAAVYWWQVWSHPVYGLEGVPLMFFFAFGFWWPGATVALVARLADRGLQPMRLRGHGVLLLAATGGAALGTGAYQLADEVYYADRDRVPLEDALVRVRGSTTPVPGGASVAVDHEGSTLRLDLSLDELGESAYALLDDLHDYFGVSRDLLERKDTDTLRVRVTAGGRSVAAMVATDADDEAGRALDALVEIDRARLPGGGDLRPVDLAEMVRDGTLLHDLPEPDARRPDGFRAETAEGAVSIVFEPSEPPGPETVVIHSAAWAAANHVLRSTVRYFPGIRSFSVRLPGLDTLLERERLTPTPAWKLQSNLPPGRRIVALEVRTLAPETTAPERSGAPRSFDPERFCPRDPRPGARITLVRKHGALTDHLAVDLFEEVPIETGPLLLTRVRPDGTVTAFTGSWEGPLEGPVSVAPGDVVSVAGEEIANLGWFAPEAVTCHGRPVFDDRNPTP